MFTHGRQCVVNIFAAVALGVVITVAGCLLLSVAAHAETPKLVSWGGFADKPRPSGVAVDQSTDDVLVAGLGTLVFGTPEEHGHMDEFTADGTLVSPPSPFGEAINAAAATNPVNGDVYVLEALNFATFTPAIASYEPSTGTLVGKPFPVQSGHNFIGFAMITQIGVDSSGDVYVPEPLKETVPFSFQYESNDQVLEYSSSGTLLHEFTDSGTLKEPSGVAVDQPTGDLWVADTGNNRIAELDSTGAPVEVGGKPVEIPSEGAEAVAVDASGDVFAVVKNSADFCGSITPPCQHLVRYDKGASGEYEQVADIGAGSIGNATSEQQLPSMLAVDHASGRVYVTDPGKNRVWVFGPPKAPALTKEFAAEITTSEAKLGALVNPGGITATYRFEYGTSTAYTQKIEGSAAGFTSRAVWASASGLAPGATYHYRVVVSNEVGKVTGPDQTFTTLSAMQAECRANEQFRVGFSASLPDCRAYELVSSPNDLSAQPDHEEVLNIPTLGENNAAVDGNRMSFYALDSMPGSQTYGFSYLATRGVGGWSTEDVIPQQSYTGLTCVNEDAHMPAYSADLSRGILEDNASAKGGDDGCNAEAVEVVRGEPLLTENLLLRDNTTGAYQLIDSLNSAPPGATPADAHFRGASSDLSHVIFSEQTPLIAGALPAPAENLYDWSGGTLRLVAVLPNGTPVAGALAAGHPHVISADGSHVFFTAEGKLYVRIDGERTEQLDEPQGGSGAGGGGRFQDASADGTKAFFTDAAAAGLTGDTVAGSGSNLYLYANGKLTDLTAAEHADVEGVSGASRDGSYAYFVAKSVLAQGATPGEPNLYAWHAGTTTFIATVNAGDAQGSTTRVSANGLYLAFVSKKSLTGYDNVDATQGSPEPELFRYDVVANHLVCVSCDPSGQSPSADGVAERELEMREGGAPHYLLDNGRVLFDTKEALLPRDTDGQKDVYEYEGGQLHMISTGTSAAESVLLDASEGADPETEGGDNVFFLTRQKLVPQDTEEEAKVIYDARVGGGFPAPEMQTCTTADACRTPVSPQPAIYGAPSSQTFSGEGNLTSKESHRRLTSKQRLRRALKVCRRRFDHNGHKRKVCIRTARRRYGGWRGHKANHRNGRGK